MAFRIPRIRPDWRTLLAVAAIAIVTATMFYSRYLAGKIAAEERARVELWAQAQHFIAKASPEQDILLASIVVTGQSEIPVIETDERDSITNSHNLDTASILGEPGYLAARLAEFKRANPPIVTYLDDDHRKFNRYYYGDSRLLKQVRYYPIVQLCIVALFIIVTLTALVSRHRAVQNRLWAGMARETAHQLGTPLSALEGWVEMLRQQPGDAAMLSEMGKDIDRLKLVTERFSRIGSHPRLASGDIIAVVGQAIEYMRKRASNRVEFRLEADTREAILVDMSPPLFEWVVENILKNALDAMEGRGMITVHVHRQPPWVHVDVTDTGKGIESANMKKVFAAGFTTKRRGWGLGLTLSKRIVEQYHGGQLVLRHSEAGKGSTFRISLKG